MGNQSSSCPPPSKAKYQPTSLPDSFFSSSRPTTTIDEKLKQLVAATTEAESTRIVFRSSDGTCFPLTRKAAEAHAGALIAEDWSLRSMVDLPEKSTVLRTLFEFIGAHKHPKLLNEKFEFLAEIAKAAEKYKVYSAMNICAERIRSCGDRHPKHVLLYAAHNDYPHIFDECAPLIVTSESLQYIAPLLPDHLRLPWLRYHERWSKALVSITTYSYSSSAWSSSSCWSNCGQVIYHALGTGLHSLGNLSWIFEERVNSHTSSCSQCRDLCKGWKAYAEKQIDGVGVFSGNCMDTDSTVKVDDSA